MPAYTRTQTGVGSTNPILLDTAVIAAPVGFQVVITSGSCTYTVEHSNDPEAWSYDTGARTQPTTWFPDANVVTKTANAEGNFIVPVQWVRLTITVGTGTARLTLRQAGPGTMP